MTLSKRRLGRPSLFVVVAALLAGLFVVPAAADAAPKKPSKVKVMTRNLYLGAVLDPAIAAPTPAEAYTAVGDIYKNVQDTNFYARAKLLANEIEADKPDLIGMQEVALWRRDEVIDGTVTPSTEPVYDYLEMLTDELKRRGLDYSVAEVQEEFDFESKVDTSGDGNPDFDGRLTMRDVVLVSNKMKVKASDSSNYSSNAFTTPASGAFGTLTILRGYNYLDVQKLDQKPKKKGQPKRPGTTFRFVNTHLESFSAYFRDTQAAELTGGSGIVDVDRPIVVVGDLNSDPDDPSISPPPLPTANAAAYGRFITDGFADYGVDVNTCCFNEDVNDTPPVTFTSRIDHVLGKGDVAPISATLIGNDPDNRSGFGLWPTDHGGVVASLEVG